jgi:hypothetical protein
LWLPATPFGSFQPNVTLLYSNRLIRVSLISPPQMLLVLKGIALNSILAKDSRVGRRHAVRSRNESARFCEHHLGISAVALNAGVFLVPAVHEIAVTTKLTTSARAAKKPHPHALTNRPALDTGAKGIDPPDNFMPGYARPIDGKQSLRSASIGLANSARLDANPHLTGTGFQKRSAYFRKLSRLRHFDWFVSFAHWSSTVTSVRGSATSVRSPELLM